MRYRHRATDIEALQWTGGNPQQLMAFTGRLRDNSPAFRISPAGGASIYSAAQDCWISVPLNDWVVRTVHGQPYVMSEASFREHFDPVPQEDAVKFQPPVETRVCNHDWRVNPFLSYLSDPPMSQVNCLRCSATKMVRQTYMGPSEDPRTWPKFTDK